MLLANALEGLGETARAKEMRAKAWSDYRVAPAFRRREERLWAYRAEPWRVVPWIGILVLVAVSVWIWRGSVAP